MYKQFQNIKNLAKTYLNFNVVEESVLYLMILADVLLLLLFWSSFSVIFHKSFSISYIAPIHSFILVWVVDLIIISLPFQIVFFKNFYLKHVNKYKKDLEALNSKIANNIQLASLIGEDKLNQFVSSDDDLSAALIALGKNLSSTKKKEEELNWIARGKEVISDVMRTSTKLNDVSINVLKTIIDYSGAVQGSIFILEGKELVNIATYAYNRQRFEKQRIPVGKGLIGEAAFEKELIYRTEIPDSYCTLKSGLLGEQKPKSLLIIPLLQETDVQGVLELAFFNAKLPKAVISLSNELSSVVGRSIYNLKINARTESLLLESQAMTKTLRENEAKLYENAKEMLVAQSDLEKSNALLAKQIQEVEHAQKRLQALLTNASEFISIYNENQELVFESPSVKRILGYKDSDKITGMDPDLLTPKGYKTINNLFQYLKDTPGGEQVAQYTYLKKNGEKLFLETQGKNLLHDPAIRGIIFNTQDITERKRAEKEERMKSRMQSLSENSPDMILRINTTGKLVYTNPAISSFMGIAQSDITKKRINELDIDQRFIDFVRHSLAAMRENRNRLSPRWRWNRRMVCVSWR
jgi:PAS domain S-box-containing protein